MIHERPGEPNDRQLYIGNLDQEVDLKKYGDNYDKINWDKKEKCSNCEEPYHCKMVFTDKDGNCKECGKKLR